MKKALLSLVCLLTLNTQAGISIGLPPGMSMPDFDSIEQSQRVFKETVEELISSEEVNLIVATVEESYLTTCLVQPEKTTSALSNFYLRYKCEGTTDLKLVIAAKKRKGVVKVKNYKVKF
ncbi:hypothetical protein [Halobacteriovorax sp. DA5]|uniref:hypothetical protein n=1 Tax=Halobacteriovorax sp. DA5 TaxID=2067553 RepID=UPI000CD27560|nr:hypothetical protein [Halobacteriovorax sp. DA5]POB14586.1 hypothetical protein C0Z22_05690 [Halobacteriovorax sp. DA5]